MTRYLQNSLLLLLFCICAALNGHTQTLPILVGDEGRRAVERPSYPLIQSRMDGPDTLRITASQPFFEDFSEINSKPSSDRWFDPEISSRGIPNISKNAAIHPPSRGVASFDGLDATGIPYDVSSLSIGKADLLLTHFLDLSGYAASNSILLTFYLQAGGRSEAPESTDSFLVSFLTPTDTFLVYSQGGGNTDFNRVSIPINKAAWFIKEFQVAFENKGSLNGALDVWHLDYIEIGLNRNTASPPPNDQSAVGLLSSPMAPYTKIPLRHFSQPAGTMRAFQVEYSNLSTTNKPLVLQSTLKESFLNTSLTPPFTASQTISIDPQSDTLITFSPFAEQSLSAISVLSLEAQVGNSGDTHIENDVFTENFPIDSVLGYDDGEADMSFGLNRPFGFGVQVTLQEEDSLSAVWINFVPTVNFNPVSNAIDYMEDRSFRFRVWSFPHPDSIFYEQVNGMRVTYGTEPNAYVRFPLNRNIALSGTFWIGIQQLNTLPIGVGYDRTFDNDALCFFDSSGVWTNVNLGGSLMIQPEFYNTTEVVLNIEETPTLELQLYPNPLWGRSMFVHIAEPEKVKRYQAVLLNHLGQKVFTFEEKTPGYEKIQIDLPAQLTKGMYIWQHILDMQSGNQEVQVEKLLIGPSN